MLARVSTAGWILPSCALARPGLIGVESGEVVSASSPAVVFRLSGTESRIRLRFRMEP